MKSLVSVIIPVYNAEDFLEEAIRSVLGQNYGNIEIIAVNDGSTDNSLGILKQYERDVIVIDQKNAGVASARNRGIAEAKGEYVAFLDNDDIFLPDKIRAQVAYLEEHADMQMCVTLCEGFLDGSVQKPEWVREGFLGVTHRNLSPSAWCMQKGLFSYIGTFDTQYVLGSDTDWIARVMKAGVEIGTIERLLWKKRVHKKNASQLLGLEDRMQYNRELLSLISKKTK